MPGALVGLTAGANLADVLRAVFEGITLAHRTDVDFLLGGIEIDAPAHVRGRIDGPCRIGLMPRRIERAPAPGRVALRGPVLLAEVDGSSTFTHFEAGGGAWIARTEGVHLMPLGAAFEGFVSPDDFYVFDAAGDLVAAPAAAESAYG